MRRHAHLFIDCALFGGAALLAFAFRHLTFVDTIARPGLGLYLIASILLGMLVFSATRTSQRVWRYFSFVDVFRIASVVGLVVLLAWSLTFLINRSDMIPRSVPVLHWVIGVGLLCGARSVARMFLKSNRSTDSVHASEVQHVLLVGTEDVAELYLRCVDRLGARRVEVTGILDENPSMRGRFLLSVPVLGRPVQIGDVVNNRAVQGIQIDRVVVATRFSELSEESRDALRAYQKRTEKPLEFFEDRLGFTGSEVQATAAETSHEVTQIKLPSVYPWVKRMMDVVGSGGLLIVCFPAILTVWAITLINLGSPAYFWQVRPGRGGKPIRVLKFRTMRGSHDDNGNRIPDQDRLTPIGTAFRHYRLDEFPQLFNILKGDMSFVGPRPLLPVDQPAFMGHRLSVRPGLSGWAQINGGRDLPKEDKAALDAWYVENMSLKLDIEITWKTLLFLFKGEKPVALKVLQDAHRCVNRINITSAVRSSGS